jgi:hypothetical protein
MQQYFIDTVSQLPELKILRFSILNFLSSKAGLSNFRPTKGLRYVEQLEVGCSAYDWEEVHGLGRYRRREIQRGW